MAISMNSEVLCRPITGQSMSGILKVQGMYCMVMNLYYRMSHTSGLTGSINLHFVTVVNGNIEWRWRHIKRWGPLKSSPGSPDLTCFNFYLQAIWNPRGDLWKYLMLNIFKSELWLHALRSYHNQFIPFSWIGNMFAWVCEQWSFWPSCNRLVQTPVSPMVPDLWDTTECCLYQIIWNCTTIM
jgi:hypothetical protein